MTARIAHLKPNRHIYTETAVPFERSMSEIQKMLKQAGCTRIGNQEDMRGNTPSFTIIFEKDAVPFMIEFPLIYERKNREEILNMNLSGRIIRDRIKALLIEVEIGASTFPSAMTQFMAIMDRTTGHPVQLENYVIEHQKELPLGTLFLTSEVH